MKIDLDVRTFLPFTLSFILFTIIGTLSHEVGHIAVAEALGYETKLHFGSMSWNSDVELKISLHFMILSGGAFQSMLTGTLGFLLLFYRRIKHLTWNRTDYLLVFLALFWTRPVFNAIISIVLASIDFQPNFFGGDEAKMATIANLPEGFFALLFGMLGLFFCVYTVFKLIPKAQRFTFIVSGLYGGLSGYGLWMKTLGPILLP